MNPDKQPHVATHLVTAAQILARYSISEITLWRWLRDNDLAFPRPLYIRKRRYWQATDLTDWEQECIQQRRRA